MNRELWKIHSPLEETVDTQWRFSLNISGEIKWRKLTSLLNEWKMDYTSDGSSHPALYLFRYRFISISVRRPLDNFIQRTRLMSRLLVSTKDFLFFFLFKCMVLFPAVQGTTKYKVSWKQISAKNNLLFYKIWNNLIKRQTCLRELVKLV